jgi:hypothetical protein
VERAGLTDEQVNEVVERVRQYIIAWAERGEQPADELLVLGGTPLPEPTQESGDAPAGSGFTAPTV